MSTLSTSEGPGLRFPTPAKLGTRLDQGSWLPPLPDATSRPPVDVDPTDTRDLAGALIRVLDDEGRAVGSWAPELDRDDIVAGMRTMLSVREMDRRMLAAQRQGKASFYMQALGEEAIACAARAALRDGDMHFPTYRQQGLLVAAGYPLADMMSQVYSNARDPLLGRQMPVFYSSRAQGFFSISGNLGTQFSQSVGWAMAAAMRGSDDIAMGWIGDGATAESDFHAALVFASTYRAPVVLSVVNNQWAISTPQATALGSATTFAARAHGFGIPGLRVDGNDYLAVYAATGWAAARARSGHGPTLVEFVTYRSGAHSSSDDPSKYRPTDEFERWPLGDPVERLEQHLEVAWDWTPDDQAALQEVVAVEVRDAQVEAEKAGTLVGGQHVSPRTMFDDVFEVQPPHLRRQRQSTGF